MLVVTHFILTLLFFVTAMSPVPSEECNALAGLYRNKGIKRVITILDGLGRRWRQIKLCGFWNELFCHSTQKEEFGMFYI